MILTFVFLLVAGGDPYDFTMGVTLNARSYFYEIGSTVRQTFRPYHKEISLIRLFIFQKFDVTVAVDGCIPISGFFLAPTQSTEYAYAYFDVTVGIDDPLVFTPPTGCTKVA